MLCLAVAAPMMASTHGWRPMDFTGRHQKLMGVTRGSITLVKEGKLSIVKAVARSREHFPFAVSGTNEYPGLASSDE